MGSHLKGNKVRPDNLDRSQDHLRAFPTEAINRWDIVTPTGSEGLHFTIEQASSILSKGAARKLYLATSPGEVRSPAEPNCIIVEQGCIRGKAGAPIDTSSAALLDPVYLSTSGGWSLTAGAYSRVIGHVVKVDDTLGIIEFDGRVGSGKLSASVTIDSGSQTKGVGFDVSFVGSPVVAQVRGTVADETTADATLTSIERCYWDGASVVVEGNADATLDTLVSIIVLP